MMRYILSLTVFIHIVIVCTAQQEQTELLYNPGADAREQITQAVETARSENKHVLVQVGGNWCSWCIMLHNFISDHPSLDSLIRADFVPVRINYSKENKNAEAMARLEYPQRFGFPVLVILDGEGQRLHTQNTAYLEQEDSYSEKKITDFLLHWNRAALDPENYANNQ